MKTLNMNRKISVLILIVVVLIYGTQGNLSYGQATTSTVQLLPATVVSPAVGEELILSLNIADGASVAGYEASIKFDTSALRYVESEIGDYLPAGAFFVPPVVTGDLVKLAATSLAGESNGDGTLARITFEVRTVKASTLTLSNVLLADSEGTISRPKVEGVQIKKTEESTPTSQTYDYIQGPWLWMIAKGSDIDADYLSVGSDGAITETQVAQNGVSEGDKLGELQWTSERIQPSTHCGFFLCASNNVQHVVNATGLTSVQNLSHHTAYAFINIVSPSDQNSVRMGVGSDDSVKVWLNGTMVHRKKVSRRTTGIQDRFDTNLKAGDNFLLVKVSEYSGNWGLFFKIYLDAADFTTSTAIGGLPINNPPADPPEADVNEDGKIDIRDLILVIEALGEAAPTNPRVDVNADGSVNKSDLLIIVENLDDSAIPAAPALREAFAAVSPETLQMWLNLLQVDSDGSVVYHKTLAILQGLLAAARPSKTALLSNYPNPFNPETWIPYQLAKDAEVTLHIYAVNGQVVRRLALGHQPAGIYQSRSRAAYWDGRNAFGEPVASGLYFYTLTAGDFTATRKMLIRK